MSDYKFKIVFYSYGKKVVDIIEGNGRVIFDRLTQDSSTDYGVTLWNSQVVEVYRQDEEDKRKWKPWRRFTNDFFENK